MEADVPVLTVGSILIHFTSRKEEAASKDGAVKTVERSEEHMPIYRKIYKSYDACCFNRA
ncbi:MAG TPA: hypothetical protein PKV75_05405 [Desulfobacterales bacterium]|nr:hypothetical protein [Desulfobacterales bacterium]